jgi:hypothetical protein
LILIQNIIIEKQAKTVKEIRMKISAKTKSKKSKITILGAFPSFSENKISVRKITK